MYFIPPKYNSHCRVSHNSSTVDVGIAVARGRRPQPGRLDVFPLVCYSGAGARGGAAPWRVPALPQFSRRQGWELGKSRDMSWSRDGLEAHVWCLRLSLGLEP